MFNHNLFSEKLFKVVVADDVRINRGLIITILKRSSFLVDIKEAKDGEEALKITGDFLPDLLILDWDMPKLSGLEVLRKLKENPATADTSVVIVTGITDTDKVVEGLNAGANDYVKKPFERVEFEARIKAALIQRESVRQIKKQNAEMMALNKTKDVFFSILAHDVKGPVNSLQAFTTMLINHYDRLSKEDVMVMSRDTEKSIKNLLNLLKDLLDWARSQTGVMQFSPTQVNVRQLFNQCLEVLQINANNKEIEISIKADQAIEVEADANAMQTVMRNLLSNAIKFTKRGGKVVLSAEVLNNDEIEIVIEDTGIGMSEKVQEKLFNLDNKVETKGTEGEAGTGLGLILSKDFIEKNGGKLGFTSEEGKGTRFFIRLNHP